MTSAMTVIRIADGYAMAGPLTTEAVVLRSMRYGEADRILHVYTPMRGRVSAIAKGVRRSRSRFGGRLEPFFRLRARPARGAQRPADRHERARPSRPIRACASNADALDAAARACDAVARLFDSAEPHPEVFNLLCTMLALLDEDPQARRGAGSGAWPSA